jgi:hypothetical protein
VLTCAVLTCAGRTCAVLTCAVLAVAAVAGRDEPELMLLPTRGTSGAAFSRDGELLVLGVGHPGVLRP